LRGHVRVRGHTEVRNKGFEQSTHTRLDVGGTELLVAAVADAVVCVRQPGRAVQAYDVLAEADQGVGCRPGGLPHKIAEDRQR